MQFRYTNDCVLSLRVPITGTHLLLLSSIEKSLALPIGAGKVDGLPNTFKAELRVKVPQSWRHFLYMLNCKSIDSNIKCSQNSFSVRSV